MPCVQQIVPDQYDGLVVNVKVGCTRPVRKIATTHYLIIVTNYCMSFFYYRFHLPRKALCTNNAATLCKTGCHLKHQAEKCVPSEG